MRQIVEGIKREGLLFMASFLFLMPSLVFAQNTPQKTLTINENCVISVLNRTVKVQAGGSWVLPNVPANFGKVRVRATCMENGVTTSGQSDFITVPTNGIIRVPDIILNAPEPIPARLTLTIPISTLTAIGTTAQLMAIATYPGGKTANVSQGSSGTNYTSSNAQAASISENGVVTAHTSGVVLVTAVNDGASALLRLSVSISGDSDGDGIPDDIELANSLNPNDPSDAMEDFDRDGLTNADEIQRGTDIRKADSDQDRLADGREVTLGTNPLLFDTDGDGVGDGLEVATGSDPLNRNSVNLAQALRFIEVKPAQTLVIVNSLLGGGSRQLQVTGQLTDGNNINLTAMSRGTTYTSSDLTVCNFGAQDGRVFGGNAGTCTITVRNGGHQAFSTVNVQVFSPIALSSIAIPGYANNVDVGGKYAYVAAGSAGLVVVDVSDPRKPVIVGSVDTPGNANDVRVVGSLVYVADGALGLQIIDVKDKTHPVIVGTVDTPGDAQDVVIKGSLAFVADGEKGLQIIDVSNPALPRILGTVDTPGIAKGVDVSGNLAVVADGYPSSAVIIIDITNPTNSQILGSVTIPGDAKDLVVKDNLAYVAAYNGGLQVVDFSDPITPRLVLAPLSIAFFPTSVALSGSFALFDREWTLNAVPIVDISTPMSPVFRANLNFSTVGTDMGTGIALSQIFVYRTGDTSLFIGQYLAEDTAGIPPTVRITSPAASGTVMEGATLSIVVDATDDVQVAAVNFLVDGVAVFTDGVAPYTFNLTVPVGMTQFTLSAQAVDYGDNVGIADNVVVSVIPDPPPVVMITSPVEGASPMEGSTITISATATDNIRVSQVVFTINGIDQPANTSSPYSMTYTVPVGITVLTIKATATDNLGRISSGMRTVSVIPDPPPVLTITSPVEGTPLWEESIITISATATDNVRVSQVVFTINGIDQPANTGSPYMSYTVPVGMTSLTIKATATDNLGRTSKDTRTVSVIPDPLPVVTITSPVAGETLVEGSTVTISATATDNIRVSQVIFTINGIEQSPDTSAPYSITYTVPVGITTLTIKAITTDNLGHVGVAPDVVITVSSATKTTVIGRVVTQEGAPAKGALVNTSGNRSAMTRDDGSFTITGVPILHDKVIVFITPTLSGEPLLNMSIPIAPMPGGTTDVGTIIMASNQYQFEMSLGQKMMRENNASGFVPFPEGLSFPFFDQTYTGVYVGDKGQLTFQRPDDGSPYKNGVYEQFLEQPKIAALFSELDHWGGPGGNGLETGVYVNSAIPGKMVVTWWKIPVITYDFFHNRNEIDFARPNTVQVILYQDGRIQMGYQELLGSGLSVVGISPGHENNGVTTMDFTFHPPLNTHEAVFVKYPLYPSDNEFSHLANRILTFTPNRGKGGYDIDLLGERRTTLTGIVVDAQGAPVQNVAIRVEDSGHKRSKETVTGADGRFSLTFVDLDETVETLQGLANTIIGGEKYAGASAKIPPQINGITDMGTIVLHKRPLTTLTGIIVDEDGTPVEADATLYLSTDPRRPITVYLLEDGRFSLPEVLADEGNITVQADYYNFLIGHYVAYSLETVPIQGGITDIGTMTLFPAPQ